ncbi:MAG: class F sortase [Flexilinea sp.]|nr:class F sortase [Flexilinea sp.]
MKKTVILLALMCLLSVFQSVFAETTYPKAITPIIYDGSDKALVINGTADPVTIDGKEYERKFLYYDESGDRWVDFIPSGHFPGNYTVTYILATIGDGNTTKVSDHEYTIKDTSGKNSFPVSIKEFNPPQPWRDRVADGGKCVLILPGTGKALGFDYYEYSINGSDWSQDIPEAVEPGTYTIHYRLSNPKHDVYPSTDPVGFTVTLAAGGPGPVQPTATPIPYSDDPLPINRRYDGEAKDLVTAGKSEAGKTWWYRLISFSNTAAEIKSAPSMTWSTVIPEGVEPGTYIVEVVQLDNDTDPNTNSAIQGDYITVVITNGSVQPQPQPQPGPNPDPQPQPQPQPGPSNTNVPIYYIGDGTTLFGSTNTLPATGFPTRIRVPLSVKPENINYESLSMRIQIPTINVDVELTGVPEVDGTWAVEWLGDQAGLLSGSALPGDGYAMIAAHNHLNTMEIGPFALLFSLEENDRIFVNTADDGLQVYSVYANELLEPDDMQKMASIAQSEANSIILVTCENEMVEGGYQNRRAVFAKPL